MTDHSTRQPIQTITTDDLVTVREASPSPAGEPIPAAPIELRCVGCKLPDRLTDAPGTLELHRGLNGHACFPCRDVADTMPKIVAMMLLGTGYALNQRTMARKLGRTALSLHRVLSQMSRLQMIAYVFTNPNLERPSAITYKLQAHVVAHAAAYTTGT